jgi:hypothetical protein
MIALRSWGRVPLHHISPSRTKESPIPHAGWLLFSHKLLLRKNQHIAINFLGTAASRVSRLLGYIGVLVAFLVLPAETGFSHDNGTLMTASIEHLHVLDMAFH